MHLSVTYLNERIELFDGLYDDAHRQELEAVARLYNRFLGPVTALHLERPELADFSMYSGSCNHSPMRYMIPDLTVRPGASDSMSIPGGGKGADGGQPLFGALGELAERLLAVLHFQAVADNLEFTTHGELSRQGRRALGPEDLPLFASQQYALPGFGFQPFTTDTPLRWIEGRELLTEEPVLVPAQLALLYYRRGRHEVPICYPTSGGLGFQIDRRRAVLHGLYEYIERDAINVRWYCRLAPPSVNLDLPSFLKRHWHLRHARTSTPAIDGIRVYLNTLDVPIPVFTVVAFDTARRNLTFLGGGGAWSGRDRALSQALFELGQTRAVLKAYKPSSKEIRPDSATTEMNDFLDGAVYFGYEENRPRLNWYISGERTVAWDDVPSLSADNESTMEWLHSSGLTPVVLDLDGACWPGVHVVRVIVPQLTPAFVAAHPYLGHPRFYDTPQRLGLSDHRLTFEELNPDPIPFP